MLRVGYLQPTRPPGHRVAQIVEHPMGRPKPIRPVFASGARASWIIAGPSDDLWRGKILDTPDAFRGIGHITSRAVHDHTSKKSVFRRYRPIPGPKVRRSSVTMLQSPFFREFRRIGTNERRHGNGVVVPPMSLPQQDLRTAAPGDAGFDLRTQTVLRVSRRLSRGWPR